MTDTTTPHTPTAADTPAERAIRAGDDRGFVGHPRGLATLFNVEMWERFSFYGMKAILAYYIYFAISEGGLGFQKSTAAVIVATYGASVYLLSIVGGWLADRVVGAWKSTLYGGIVIMAGHICMAVPFGAMFSWAGLCLIALGTGLLKPNISTMVGSLYRTDDPRRDAGFEIFYMSINIGSFFSPFVVAFLRNRWGFHAGFAAAAVGMAFSLLFYVLGTKRLHGAGQEIPNPLDDKEKRRVPLLIGGLLVAVVALWFLTGVLRGFGGDEIPARINDVVFIIAVVASVYYFVAMLRHPKTDETDRRHVLAYLPLYVGACLFWMVFEQASGYMAVFAESNTNLHLGGITIDPEWYQSVNPIGIVVMAPLFGWIFTRRAGRFPSTPVKFASAVLLIGLTAFMMSWLFAAYPGESKLAPFWMLGLVFLIQTVGELMLSPVGLSATTTLAPKHFASQVMGLWFLTSSVGQGMAGQIIKVTENSSPAQAYLINGVLTVVLAVLLFALVPWTRKQMADVEETRRNAVDRMRAGAAADTPPEHDIDPTLPAGKA